jgi:flagellar biogenesis protein FliO
MPGTLLAASHVAATPDISIGHVLVQMVVAMGIIVGGIWGLSKLVGRSRAAGRSAGRKAGTFLRQRGADHGLTILSRQPLGKGKCLAVVQVGTQQFLVGIADSGLTPLGELHTAGEAQGDASGSSSAGVTADAALAAGSGLAQTLGNGPFSTPEPTTGTFAFGGAGLEGIDLSALAARPRGSGHSGQPASRPIRGWLDALREATVRR